MPVWRLSGGFAQSPKSPSFSLLPLVMIPAPSKSFLLLLSLSRITKWAGMDHGHGGDRAQRSRVQGLGSTEFLRPAVTVEILVASTVFRRRPLWQTQKKKKKEIQGTC
ncbi:hypothetical protein PspLS_00061 [Pyricularia sp. CBS 133598]|nr:hypothetical protein PspLS_00061 [Pyricularia sp. CBS 133598]